MSNFKVSLDVSVTYHFDIAADNTEDARLKAMMLVCDKIDIDKVKDRKINSIILSEMSLSD